MGCINFETVLNDFAQKSSDTKYLSFFGIVIKD